MSEKYKIQRLNISSDWTFVQNRFFDIDPKDNVPDSDKQDYIYWQEDMLLITRGSYHLDLGWYGAENFANNNTGYCIHLYRGTSWNNAELLEKMRSKDKQVIVSKIEKLTKVVDMGGFEKLTGYIVDEDDPANHNNFNDYDFYSARGTR